ncbi:MAG TPA: PAS domain S-box protein [Firmicutes bacterium]|nr:PAS domain S-box protein [Bacillota bacterium]
MSEYINNSEMRKNTLKDIIKQLHEGKTVEEVKQQFEETFGHVSASEITAAEADLIAEGVSAAQIQSLCDVHAAVFKGSIDEIHQTSSNVILIPGHPINVLMRENLAINRIINQSITPYLHLSDHPDAFNELLAGLHKLSSIDLHYQKKENLFFPYMEKHGITAPPQVMWGVDDDIRAELKRVKAQLLKENKLNSTILSEIKTLLTHIEEMIFKEENIMAPLLLEHLTQEEWKLIADDSHDIGFLVENVPHWNPTVTTEEKPQKQDAPLSDGLIKLPSGVVNVEQLTWMLNTLPFDITFVDKDDCVKYFSEGKERTFIRARSIIGRNVSNCHPPKSVHIVEKIVEDFKSGRKDQEDFWIKMGDKYIFIRYYAVRNENKEYLGVLEVTQDINPIQAITGEKRLLEEL